LILNFDIRARAFSVSLSLDLEGEEDPTPDFVSESVVRILLNLFIDCLFFFEFPNKGGKEDPPSLFFSLPSIIGELVNFGELLIFVRGEEVERPEEEEEEEDKEEEVEEEEEEEEDGAESSRDSSEREEERPGGVREEL